MNKHPLLQDPERRIKEIFDEKRKQRLLQVRAESRKIAQNIRVSVAAERERQIQQLEECKNQAKRLWRQEALEQLRDEFNASLADVGSAHLAAVQEKKEFVERVLRLQAGADERRRRVRSAASQRRLKATSEAPAQMRRKQENAQSTAAMAGTTTHTSVCISARKRKRGGDKKCTCEHRCCCAGRTQSPEKEQEVVTLTDTDSDFSCEFSDSDASDEQNEQKINKLCCTPAVVVEVDSESADAELLEPCCMRDDHLTNNRQFCSVASLDSPEKKIKVAAPAKARAAPAAAAKTRPATTAASKKVQEPARTQFIKTATKAPTAKPREKAAPSTAQTRQIQRAKSPAQKNTPATFTTTKPASPAKIAAESESCNESPAIRFTAITDLLEEQQRQKRSSPRKQKPPAQAAQSPQKVAKFAAPDAVQEKAPDDYSLPCPASPQKRAKGNTLPSSLANDAPSRSANKYEELAAIAAANCARLSRPRAMPQSNSTASSKSKSYAGTSKSSERRTSTDVASKSVAVQCYDYNNKFEKSYPQPENLVERVERSEEPNAMEMATLERQKQCVRDEDIARIRKKVEERGQKALEREKVRRDCNDLGAKLDELTKQHGEAALMGNDTNIYTSHRFADRVARKEANMNAAVEELLNRPAVITCPEIKRTGKSTEPAPSQPLSSTENFANFCPNMDNLSSDSYRSSIIEYVEDQSQILKNDLKTILKNPAQNQTKTDRLKCMLQRIEKLRESLLAELNNSARPATKKNVQNMISSIQRMQNEREDLMQDAVSQEKPKATQKKQRTNEENGETACLQEYERRFRESEAILDKKLREYYKLKKKSAKEAVSQASQPILVTPTGGEPVEIVIKVNPSNKEMELETRTGSKRNDKSAKCPKLERDYKQMLQQCQRQLKTQTQKQNPCQYAQNICCTAKAYDSASTGYLELPAAINVDRPQTPYSTTSEEDRYHPECRARLAKRVDPLIAQYIQRLLNMPRSAINNLQVSTSCICTPSTSVVDVTGNITESACELEETTTETDPPTEECLQRVQRFVQDNRSFIKELEDTLRMHEHENLETNMRAFEEVWKQRLAKNKKLNLNAQTEPNPCAYVARKCKPARAATEHTKKNEVSEYRVTKAPVNASEKAAALPTLTTSAINVEEMEQRPDRATPREEPQQNISRNAPVDQAKRQQQIVSQEPVTEKPKETTQQSNDVARAAEPKQTSVENAEENYQAEEGVEHGIFAVTNDPNSKSKSSKMSYTAEPKQRDQRNAQPKQSKQQNAEENDEDGEAHGLFAVATGPKQQPKISITAQTNQRYQINAVKNKRTYEEEKRAATSQPELNSKPDQMNSTAPPDNASTHSTNSEQRLLRRLSELATIVNNIPADTEPQELKSNVQELLPQIDSIVSDILKNLPNAQASTRQGMEQPCEQTQLQQELEPETFKPIFEILSDILRNLPPETQETEYAARQNPEQRKADDGLTSEVLQKLVQLQEQLNRIEAERRLRLQAAARRTNAASCPRHEPLATEEQRRAAAEREVDACLRTIQARQKQQLQSEAQAAGTFDAESYSFSELYKTDAYYKAQQCARLQEPPPKTDENTTSSNQVTCITPITQNTAVGEQASRYAQLTENCNQRIMELNKLICKVRNEKQKLIEHTLSSISDTMTPSTEHVELPCRKSPAKAAPKPAAPPAAPANARSKPAAPPAAQTSTLEQHRQLGASLDSGIGVSRPVTAQEQRAELEPPSQTSTYNSQCRRKLPTGAVPRSSPELSQREQPHDLSTIHEAETPLTSRVKTCATAASAEGRRPEQVGSEQTAVTPPQYAPFPTFEQYIEQIQVDLDLTQLDPEVSMRLEQQYNRLLQSICNSTTSKASSARCTPTPDTRRKREYEDFHKYVEKLNLTQAQLQSETGYRLDKEFRDLLEAVENAQGNNALDPRAFPTLSAYLHDVTGGTACSFLTAEGEPETINALLEQLRQANLTIRQFPPIREYVRQLPTNTPDDQQSLLDTASLENLSTCADEEDDDEAAMSDSLTLANIETELRRRNLLQHCPNQIEEANSRQKQAACTGASVEAQPRRQVSFRESGLERLCSVDTTTSSNLSGALERELAKTGINWPDTMRRKKQQTQALSSSTTTTTTDVERQQMPPPACRPTRNVSAKSRNNANTGAGAQTTSQCAAEGNALNLHEFLMRELMKNTNTSSASTTSTTPDSICREFEQSIGLTTPNNATRRYPRSQSQNTQVASAQNLERQRTSTPVNLANANRTNRTTSNSSTTPLFSGSGLSSVHCATRSSNERERERQRSKNRSFRNQCTSNK